MASFPPAFFLSTHPCQAAPVSPQANAVIPHPPKLNRFMPSQRSVSRILVNIALDGALAAVAAPIARYIAAPDGGLLHPLWFVAGGGITRLLGGLPFRLSQQYWRVSGLSDLVGVAGGAAASAGLFSGLLLPTGFRRPTPPHPGVPPPPLAAVDDATLAPPLGPPLLAHRLYPGRARVSADDPGLQRVLVV